MIYEAKESEQKKFNLVATHPLQSWEWGEFRKKTGVEVTRLVVTEKEKIISSFQITWHKMPMIGWKIGYCPKSKIPNKEELEKILEIGKKKGAILVKFEPNEENDKDSVEKIKALGEKYRFQLGKSLFTKFSMWLDIDKSEDEILKNMSQKTRYNVRLSEKKGVKVIEDNTEDGFEEYWKLMEETTKRQGFFAHTKSYHQKMWKTMRESGMAHLFRAVYQGKTLTTWILFNLNGVLYYPYGASSNISREVMASNAMMWEAIRFGKKMKCRKFDLWGSLGPVPDTTDPWYGFHKFKSGFGPKLVEFVGTYDLIISPSKYFLYGVIDKLRWVFLKILARVR